jgi:hypothetical protein
VRPCVKLEEGKGKSPKVLPRSDELMHPDSQEAIVDNPTARTRPNQAGGLIMIEAAVNFEYEWMSDGSLRLRFLSRDDAILGQQMVAAEGLVALQILIALAVAKAAEVKPEDIMAMLRGSGLDADLDIVIDLIESVRVRAGTTPEGDVGLIRIEED